MADSMTAMIATFDDEADATGWLKRLEERGYSPTEGIVIRRDEDGKVHKHLTNLPGLFAGAGAGAVIGAILGAIFPPLLIGETLAVVVGSAAAGAVAGGGAVAIKDEVVERRAFKDVGEQLEPGQSALIVVLPTQEAARFDAELEGYAAKWSEVLPED